ncbi:MAG: glycosyltransferase family 2 protein [Firmicutes bacterium]|nr:glycosyltransferase family 2 protein [Bacillota bacterium]
MILLSIVLISFNSRRDLAQGLPYLFAQSVDPLEVVVVDNGSQDGTVAWLRDTYPAARVVSLSQNLGYGAAANVGIGESHGAWVMVANPDTRFMPGSLQALLEVARQRPDALLTPKLVLADGRVNALGNVMNMGGIASCWHYGEDAAGYRGVLEVPLLSGAAILAHREIWTRLGGFDPAIFLYMEDVDLSLRARLLGLRLYAVADAVVVHDYALRLTPAKLRWLEQHRQWTLLKIFRLRTLWKLAPAILLTNAMTWGFAWTRGLPYLKARLQADLWLWGHLAQLVRARRQFQPQRRREDTIVLTGLTLDLPWSQIEARAWTRRLATCLLHWAWAWSRWRLAPRVGSHEGTAPPPSSKERVL